MPMELYSSEAFVRDLVNAISNSEGKPLNIGGNHHRGIDRAYAFDLIVQAKRALEGQTDASEPSAAGEKAASRTAKIKKFMADLEQEGEAPPAAKPEVSPPAELPAARAKKTPAKRVSAK